MKKYGVLTRIAACALHDVCRANVVASCTYPHPLSCSSRADRSCRCPQFYPQFYPRYSVRQKHILRGKLLTSCLSPRDANRTVTFCTCNVLLSLGSPWHYMYGLCGTILHQNRGDILHTHYSLMASRFDWPPATPPPPRAQHGIEKHRLARISVYVLITCIWHHW